MQDKVQSRSTDFPNIIVQYHPEHGELGIGIEPRDDVPSLHFIDAMYGEVPVQTAVGKLFNSRANEVGWDIQQFESPDEEADYHNKLGRLILDSVTGSTARTGMWTWLDRPAANRLIRLIRKGRDITFGRDE